VNLFNAVIPQSPPIVAVQVDSDVFNSQKQFELISKLEAFFMVSVSLVAWDENSKFTSYGAYCMEADLISEDIAWREFQLPTDAEIPF
jgi:hypothetical protein